MTSKKNSGDSTDVHELFFVLEQFNFNKVGNAEQLGRAKLILLQSSSGSATTIFPILLLGSSEGTNFA